MRQGTVLAMTDTNTQIRADIRGELARNRRTQADLAKQIGRSAKWVNRRMTGSAPITLADLDLIASGLNVMAGGVVELRVTLDRPTS